MIDTIFYFCPTQEQYEQTLTENGGEGISSRTITFVEDVREIYFNGRGYGKTSTAGLITDDQFETWKNTIQVRLNQIISDAENDLQDLQTQLSTEIQDAISQALHDQNGKSIWTKITETDEGVSAVTTQISDLSDRLDNISTNGDIQYSAVLQSVIDEGIRNNTAFTNLQSRWAVLNENQAVLEWMASGFKSQVNENTNFATVFSAYQDEVDSNQSTIAALQTKANANEAKLNAIANWNGYVEGQPVSYYGGLVTASNMDGAIAALIANSNTDTSAAITANVTRNTSNITLSADKIYLDANTTLANTIQATQGSIGGFTISQNSLSAEQGDYRIELTPLHFATYYNNTVTNEIKSTGSGSIASGGISWTNDGTITLSQEFLRSLFNELHNGAVNQDVYGGINETFPIYEGRPNILSYYIDDIRQLQNEDSLWSTSYIAGAYNDGTGQNVSEHCIRLAPFGQFSSLADVILNSYRSDGQTYPINGTVQEKRDWYFRYYDTIGTFQSGILVNKKMVDHETQLEKDQLSELYIDNRIYIIHIPTLNEFATANSLDITKFKGIVSGSQHANDPYHNSYVKLYFASRSQYSGGQHDFWNVYYDSNGYRYRYNNLTRVDITFRTTAYVRDHGLQDLLANPTEGTWLFVGSHGAYVDGDVNNTGAYYNQYTLDDEIYRRTPQLSQVILKYTNGAWTVLENPTFLQKTVTQYRGNESE